MPTAYSCDIRGRVIARVESGASRREAAEQFEISPCAAIKWVACFRATRQQADRNSTAREPGARKVRGQTAWGKPTA